MTPTNEIGGWLCTLLQSQGNNWKGKKVINPEIALHTEKKENNIFELAQIHLPLSVCSVNNSVKVKGGMVWEYVRRNH
jgi:hypothetical protein